MEALIVIDMQNGFINEESSLCIRTTCYDGISPDYDVTVIEDACSSNTDEIQKANMDDMKRAGAEILTSDAVLNRRRDGAVWADECREE